MISFSVPVVNTRQAAHCILDRSGSFAAAVVSMPTEEENSSKKLVKKPNTQKRAKKMKKKGLPKAERCGIILKRQGLPERMTSERRRKRKGRTNVRTLKSEITSSQNRKASEKSA